MGAFLACVEVEVHAGCMLLLRSWSKPSTETIASNQTIDPLQALHIEFGGVWGHELLQESSAGGFRGWVGSVWFGLVG